MIKVFESERINYVKVDPNLINDYLKMINDKETQKWIGMDNIEITFDDEMKWINEQMSSNHAIFSMIEKSTNEFIGNIEIMNKDNNTGELGICITRDKQDKHYGEESIKRILEYANNELSFDTIYLNVYKDNTRAIKCYEKCNFIIDGDGKKPSDYHMTYKGDK